MKDKMVAYGLRPFQEKTPRMDNIRGVFDWKTEVCEDLKNASPLPLGSKNTSIWICRECDFGVNGEDEDMGRSNEICDRKKIQ